MDVQAIEAAISDCGVQQIGAPQAILPAGAGWGISQSPKEAAAFLAVMHARGVRSMLEIGTFTGGFARFCGEVMGWDVVSVDVQRPIVTRGYTFVHSASADYTPEGRFDLVFLDGDHSYEGVKADYERFLPYADNAIALHDVFGNHACEGVRDFFAEIDGPEWTVEGAPDWPLGIAWKGIDRE
jgi:hypothetical protein